MRPYLWARLGHVGVRHAGIYTPVMARPRFTLGGALIGALATFAVGVLVGGALNAPPSQEAAAQAGTLDEIAGLLDNRSTTDSLPQDIRDGAINGMLQALNDPWAEFYSADQVQSSGAQAGTDPSPLHVSAEFLADDLRVVKIDSFAEGVAEQVANALAGEKSGVLLDLRGNQGGLLEEAVGVASLFFDGGRVVSYSERGGTAQFFEARRGGDVKTPVVVLVDALTASSAEIVTAALQERGRAIVVGQRTFGKSSVQEPFTISDGSQVKFTVGHYRTPSGRDIDGIGVAPDVEADYETGRSRALEILSGLAGDR